VQGCSDMQQEKCVGHEKVKIHALFDRKQNESVVVYRSEGMNLRISRITSAESSMQKR
jgi:hypothetical protein